MGFLGRRARVLHSSVTPGKEDQSRFTSCCDLPTKKQQKLCAAHPAALSSCMSANRFARAARPVGRSLTRSNNPCLSGRQHFTTSSLRRTSAGNGSGPRAASAWSLPSVFAAAAAAGLLGWGASELRHRGFPGTVLFDGTFPGPRYASMREMELVRGATHLSPSDISMPDTKPSWNSIR